MELGFDLTTLGKLGVGGVVALGLIALIYGIKLAFQAFQIVMEQWRNSTDAVNKNTEAFQELSKVFEKSYERELEFQTEMRERVKDTQKKVNEIHKKIV